MADPMAVNAGMEPEADADVAAVAAGGTDAANNTDDAAATTKDGTAAPAEDPTRRPCRR